MYSFVKFSFSTGFNSAHPLDAFFNISEYFVSGFSCLILRLISFTYKRKGDIGFFGFDGIIVSFIYFNTPFDIF